MNESNFSQNLIKQIDLIHYWEPFAAFTKKGEPASWRSALKELIKSKIKSPPVRAMTWQKQVLIAYDTMNQFQMLSHLIDTLPEANVLSLYSGTKNQTLPHDGLMALGEKYRLTRVRALLSFSGFDRQVYAQRFYKTQGLLGLYEWMRLSMQASKPTLKYFIGANDHAGISQIGFTAARKCGIKTIYLQHASVSDKFPPLQTDYALLDGKDAAEKYAAAGRSQTQTFLVGSSKYDPYLSNPEINIPGNSIGICIGHIKPNHEDLIQLGQQLEIKGFEIMIRPHPGVDQASRQIYSKHGWSISRPEDETALDFIMNCHTVISADSNILLEALLLKRRPIYLAHNPEFFDYYGFLERGLLEKACKNAEEAINLIESPYELEHFRPKAQYYQDTLYTEWEGKSAALVRDTIQKIIAQKQ